MMILNVSGTVQQRITSHDRLNGADRHDYKDIPIVRAIGNGKTYFGFADGGRTQRYKFSQLQTQLQIWINMQYLTPRSPNRKKCERTTL